MNRFLACGAFALMAAISPAVFDLQQVSRYSSSVIGACSFTHVAAKSGGGFIAGGTAGSDILLAEFDSFGILLRSTIWDSPLVLPDTLQGLWVYQDGRVLISVGTPANSHLVQFSRTLIQNWEIHRDKATKGALDGNGNAFLVGDALFEVVNSAGAIQSSSAVSGFQIYAVKGIPGILNAGCIAVGRDTTANLPRAIRFRTNATQAYSVLDATSAANANHHHADLDISVLGDSVIVGKAIGFTLTSLSNTGSGPTSHMGANELRLPKIRNSTELYASVINEFEGTYFSRLHRESGGTFQTKRFVDGFIPAGYELTGPGVIEVASGVGLYRIDSTSWSSLANLSAPTLAAATALSTSRGVSVGKQSDGAAIALSDGVSNGLGRSILQVPSGAARILAASKPLPDGSIAIIAKQSNLNGVSLLAIRYRPDGTLAFVKAIPFGPARIDLTRVGALTAFPDGSFTYAENFVETSWGFAHVSASGLVTTKTIPPLGGKTAPAASVPLSNGTTALISFSTSDALRYTQMSSAGTILQEHTYADVVGGRTTAKPQAVLLPNGSLAVAMIIANTGAVSLRSIDPATGVASTPLSVGSFASEVRLDVDSSGNLLLAYSNTTPSVVVQRRSASDFATVLNTTTLANRPTLKDLGACPNGNLVILTSGAASEMTILGSGAFPIVGSAPLVATMTNATDLVIDASNVIYVTGLETQAGVTNVYSARYLPTGIRSAQRRTAGRVAGQIHVAGSGVWVTGDVGTRKKGVGPFAARYSL